MSRDERHNRIPCPNGLPRWVALEDRTDHKGVLLPGDPEYKSDRVAAGICHTDEGEVAITLQCVHCGMHWIPIRGSGRRRGFCTNCCGPLCGKKECLEACMPYEKRLDIRDRIRKADAVVVGPKSFDGEKQALILP